MILIDVASYKPKKRNILVSVYKNIFIRLCTINKEIKLLNMSIQSKSGLHVFLDLEYISSCHICPFWVAIMHHSIGVYHVFIVCRTGLRSICILLPILGITWVFGVFAVNEGTVVFQYLFAICNSLQVCFRTEQNRTQYIFSVNTSTQTSSSCKRENNY